MAPTIRPMRDYAIDIWTTREGLPHNSLRKIVQTPDGLIWLATWEGLVRYNGQEFTTFDRGSTPGLLDNAVGTLHVDRQGALWVGDSRGNLSRYDSKGHWQHFERELPAPGVLIQGIASDQNGRLWLQYEGKGLGHLDPGGRFNFTPPPDDLSVLLTYPGLVVDSLGQVWLGTMDGVLMRDSQGQLRRAPASFGLPAAPAWPYLAPDGVLWLVVGNRIYRMRDGRPQLHYSVDEQTFLTAMLVDSKGLIWLGTESDGLMRLGPHGLERLPEGKQLPGGRILSMFEDNEGSIWVGANGGLFRLRETLFTSYGTSDGLSGNYARSVLEDQRGRIWVGTAQGLDRMETDGRIGKIDLSAVSHNAVSVLSLAQGPDGAVWAGTFSDGVIRIDGDDRLTHYPQVQQLSSGNVRAIEVDADNQVWVGTQGGLLRISNGVVDRPQIHGLPKQELVIALGQHQGNLWVGSTEGVRVVLPDRVQRLELNQLGGARTVFGLQSVGNAMWISTDRGLYRYRDGQLGHVGLEQGLPVDAVFQLVPDRLGNVWLSSNRGVLRTDMVSLNDVADGRRDLLETVERYSEIDGMSNSQANGSSGPGAMLDRHGRYWVVTAGGLSVVDPQHLRQLRERPAPRPMLEQVRVNGQLQDWRNNPLSVPGGARLSISYVGLSYLISDRIRYRTRLVGLDEEWIERGRQRSVEYIGLPPGEYTLQVASMHPGGRWSLQAAELHFRVAPLWWQNAWVWMVAVFALLLLWACLYRYGVYRYKAHNQRLARLVDQRTYDLQLQAESLLAANQEKTRLLERLREQSEAFERQAREDPLTGLPNRRVFDEALTREFSRHQRSGHPLCLVVLDIDHFKTVNDRFSHSVGDQVLKDVGQLLLDACREGDLPARLGGEEFALLLGDTTADEAEQLCSRLQGLFHQRHDWGGVQGLTVTFSAGLVQARSDDRQATDLYQRADHALYRAKSSGRDVTCVE
ncbi:MAG: diguanylate cyclase [Stenotrophomonas koreensis]